MESGENSHFTYLLYPTQFYLFKNAERKKTNFTVFLMGLYHQCSPTLSNLILGLFFLLKRKKLNNNNNNKKPKTFSINQE